MNLPKKRNFNWPLKPFGSAETEINHLSTGQIEVIIRHEIIKGITVEMLHWWFSHFTDMTIEVNGKTYPAYFVWHPNDHIGVTAFKSEEGRPMKAGDHIRIEEAFQRNAKYLVSEKALVSELSTQNMGLKGHALGQTILHLRHSFNDVEGGVQYHSRMLLGLEKGLLKPFVNNVILPRRFNEEKAEAWLIHNIEEVGYFENFLARLYARRESGKHISLD
ncbi:MAG: hypothetical protein AAF902_17220 [Chloroflexota bacterium]